MQDIVHIRNDIQDSWKNVMPSQGRRLPMQSRDKYQNTFFQGVNLSVFLQ
jgi:hypothetical protein